MSYNVYYNSRYPQCKRICKKKKKNGGNKPFLYRGILRYTLDGKSSYPDPNSLPIKNDAPPCDN